jgi:hypothetical protein
VDAGPETDGGITMENTGLSPTVQKSNCRFQASKAKDGKPTIKLEIFHPTVSSIGGVTIEFELMGGTTSGEATALADAVNDRIISIVLTQP